MGASLSKHQSENIIGGTTTTVSNNEEHSSKKKAGNKSLPSSHPSISSGNVSGGGGCPVKLESGGYFGRFSSPKVAPTESSSITNECPVKPESSPVRNECPVKGNGEKQQQYNVYSQPIDPKNNMPAVANQLPAPTQSEEISTHRVKSKIPKGGSDGSTWVYPSPQMFYNSLVRKNKLGDTKEADVESVVALHNNMNETTWNKIVEWERVVHPEGNIDDGNCGAKLLKFIGRPADLSPKAWFKNLVLGHPLPFDRHDWTILRTDGKQVRYVIDYYHDESSASEEEGSGMPDMDDRDAVKSILVDVRPALDNVKNAFGRFSLMPYARNIGGTATFTPLPLIPTIEMTKQVKESEEVWESIQENVRQTSSNTVGTEEKSMILTRENMLQQRQKELYEEIEREEAVIISKNFSEMMQKCVNAQKAVDNCESEAECAKSSLALSLCMAKILCPLQHSAVSETLESSDQVDHSDERASSIFNARVDAALENVQICIQNQSERATVAKDKYQDEF